LFAERVRKFRIVELVPRPRTISNDRVSPNVLPAKPKVGRNGGGEVGKASRTYKWNCAACLTAWQPENTAPLEEALPGWWGSGGQGWGGWWLPAFPAVTQSEGGRQDRG
jgi:hypothetical protein